MKVLVSAVGAVLPVLIFDVGESVSVVLVASLIEELADVNSGANDTACDALVDVSVDSEDDRSVDEDCASVIEAGVASDLEVDTSDDGDPVSAALDVGTIVSVDRPPEDIDVVSAVLAEAEVASTEEIFSDELATDEVVETVSGSSL